MTDRKTLETMLIEIMGQEVKHPGEPIEGSAPPHQKRNQRGDYVKTALIATATSVASMAIIGAAYLGITSARNDAPSKSEQDKSIAATYTPNATAQKVQPQYTAILPTPAQQNNPPSNQPAATQTRASTPEQQTNPPTSAPYAPQTSIPLTNTPYAPPTSIPPTATPIPPTPYPQITSFRSFYYSRETIDQGLFIHPEAKKHLADRFQLIFRSSFWMQGHGFLTFDNWLASNVGATLDTLLDGKSSGSNPELTSIASHQNGKGDYVLEIRYSSGSADTIGFFAQRTPDQLINLDNFLNNTQDPSYAPTAAPTLSFVPLNADESAIKMSQYCFSAQNNYNLYVLFNNLSSSSDFTLPSPTNADTTSMMDVLTDGKKTASKPGQYNPRDYSSNGELTGLKTTNLGGNYKFDFQVTHSDTVSAFSVITPNIYFTHWLTDTFSHPNCNGVLP